MFFAFRSKNKSHVFDHPLYPLFVLHLPFKRVFDVCFSLCVFALAWPVFLMICVWIVSTTRRSPFFWHQRIGRGGRPFWCIKFETMCPDAPRVLETLLAQNPAYKRSWDLYRKIPHDPRITRVGFWLRKTSLDELPQFWNVLKGEMSVVGPRAVPLEELTQHFRHRASTILQLRPGITGLWQVSGRSALTYAQRVDLEVEYVHTRSFCLDCKIMWKTIWVMWNCDAAY